LIPVDVTAFLARLDWGPFTQIAMFFHNYAYSLVALLSLIAAPYLRRRGGHYALAGAMVLAIVMALFLKDLYDIPRPCNDWLTDAKACTPPEDYGFPSGHTAFAFVFVAASLGTAVFPVYLVLGIIIAFSRIYLGVHSIEDVAGGVVLGMLSYLVFEEAVDAIGRGRDKKKKHGGK